MNIIVGLNYYSREQEFIHCICCSGSKTFKSITFDFYVMEKYIDNTKNIPTHNEKEAVYVIIHSNCV